MATSIPWNTTPALVEKMDDQFERQQNHFERRRPVQACQVCFQNGFQLSLHSVILKVLVASRQQVTGCSSWIHIPAPQRLPSVASKLLIIFHHKLFKAFDSLVEADGKGVGSLTVAGHHGHVSKKGMDGLSVGTPEGSLGASQEMTCSSILTRTSHRWRTHCLPRYLLFLRLCCLISICLDSI